MKKICILLPTYGREQCVAYFLEQVSNDCRNYEIDIYICDSSEKDINKRLVKKYNNEGFKNVFYLRGHDSSEYKNSMVAKNIYGYPSPDYKVYMAQCELAMKYDYIWLCGDNCVLNLDQLMEDVRKYTAQDVDIIHFSNGSEMSFGEDKQYTDASEFYLNDAWHMTAFGASIVSSRVIRFISKEDILDKYINSGFLYVMSVYEYCAKNAFTAVHCHRRFHRNNPYRKLSGWIASGDALGVFGQNWVEVNFRLSNLYEDLKKSVIKSFSIHTGLFGYKKCFWLRAYGNISIKKIVEYRKYIPLVTDTNILWFYIIACCPKLFVKWIWESFVLKE